MQNLLRVVAAFMFVPAGAMKLFGWPAGRLAGWHAGRRGGTVDEQIGIGGTLEAVEGLWLYFSAAAPDPGASTRSEESNVRMSI
ncbi:MAG TPA: hypothetical protein VFK57_21335 [Vicinamibacterales bacterium]|nr:hypothetical protein [Vicinamibacterales bacterium]